MNSKIITWNMRGMNDPNKRAIIKVGIKKWGADLVCFQETKMEALTNAIERSVRGGRWVKLDFIPTRESAGVFYYYGIGENWRSWKQRKGMIAARIRDIETWKVWEFGGAYGLMREGTKMGFWEEMAISLVEWETPWVLGGILILLSSRRKDWSVDR